MTIYLNSNNISICEIKIKKYIKIVISKFFVAYYQMLANLCDI